MGLEILQASGQGRYERHEKIPAPRPELRRAAPPGGAARMFEHETIPWTRDRDEKPRGAMRPNGVRRAQRRRSSSDRRSVRISPRARPPSATLLDDDLVGEN